MYEFFWVGLTVLCFFCTFGETAHYNYQDFSKWNEISRNCSGNRQSPINIVEDDLIVAKTRNPILTFKNYDEVPKNMTIENIGHTVRIQGKWENEKNPAISGSILNGKYRFAQAHFHWGAYDETGSEHRVNGKAYPAEIHFVHYKNDYGSFENALNHVDGMVVIAHLYQAKCCNKTGIIWLEDGLKKVRKISEVASLRPFPLNSLKAKIEGKYVTYAGSLTTPPCNQVVTWIVNAHSRSITKEQLASLRQIELYGGDKHNFRNVQFSNDRKIYYIDDTILQKAARYDLEEKHQPKPQFFGLN